MSREAGFPPGFLHVEIVEICVPGMVFLTYPEESFMGLLFLNAPLKERIWGGRYFKEVLHLTDSDEPIGELWSCSAHPEGESLIAEGLYQGQRLSQVYREHPELFAYPREKEFPILVKLIQTEDLLSVQVHPDDAYALEHEHQQGKTEGWLILGRREDSSIVIGHKAKDAAELRQFVRSDDYGNLLNYRGVEVGEFYPIPSGTIHALGKGLLLLEIQQSSDVTYRFYDYHRKDKNGAERELHVQKALDVASCSPYEEPILNCRNIDDGILWKNAYFTVSVKRVSGECRISSRNSYKIVSVAEGSLKAEHRPLHLGESFIVTASEEETTVSGNGRIVITETNRAE